MNINDFYKNYLGITTPYTHQIKIWEIIEKGKYPILLRAPYLELNNQSLYWKLRI